MDLRVIAARIASVNISFEEHTGYNASLLDLVSEEMKTALGVPRNAKPYEGGMQSVVYDNQRGNIVVFSSEPQTEDIAKRITGQLKSILPEVYDVQSWEDLSYPNGQIIGVEMEKLRPLDKDEVIIWTAWEDDFTFGYDDPDGIANVEMGNIKTRLTRKPSVEFLLQGQGRTLGESEITKFSRIKDHVVEAIKDLATKAYDLGVTQNDAHCENVAWDDTGKLKFIDLESIDLVSVELAPQSRAASWLMAPC